MQGTAALVVTKEELKKMLEEVGRISATQILNSFKAELNTNPIEKQTKRLQTYIQDRNSIENPREEWANGRHIRRLNPSKNGKPKSMSWFKTFKEESTLNKCFNRPSPDHGRLQEWTFEDVANAWDHFHRQRCATN
ncbi:MULTISPECIES: hypothetical protein [unclassified Lentilitoribacter]|uniref:hypothetical protein n=1 Tax=unclassified Lentilitoribacter TaxID=2647570 RepID=UPI0013A6FB46|nr:hypothetical protein [Lentilitoribacter sp. Alg239-R112]